MMQNVRDSDDDWERDYSLLPNLFVHGELQRPVGFIPLREWLTPEEAARERKRAKKKGRKKRP